MKLIKLANDYFVITLENGTITHSTRINEENEDIMHQSFWDNPKPLSLDKAKKLIGNESELEVQIINGAIQPL